MLTGAQEGYVRETYHASLLLISEFYLEVMADHKIVQLVPSYPAFLGQDETLIPDEL